MPTIIEDHRKIGLSTVLLVLYVTVHAVLPRVSHSQDTYFGTTRNLAESIRQNEVCLATNFLFEGPVQIDDFDLIARNCSIDSLSFGAFPDLVDFSNGLLDRLARLDNLVQLELQVVAVDGLDWGSLTAIETLKHLRISGDLHFSKDDLFELSKLKILESLEISAEFSSGDCFDEFGSLESVSFLSLSSNRSINFAALAKCFPNLKRFEFAHNDPISLTQLEEFAKNGGNKLTNLKLIVEENAIDKLANQFPNLKTVAFTFVNRTKFDPNPLSNLQKLEEVYLYQVVCDNSEVIAVAEAHPRLRTVVVSASKDAGNAFYWRKH